MGLHWRLKEGTNQAITKISQGMGYFDLGQDVSTLATQ